jgi:citrate lyase beta subunit
VPLLIIQLRTRHIEAIALPKTNSPEHIEWLVSTIDRLCPTAKRRGGSSPMRIIGMIESAEGMVRIGEIAASGKGHLDALLVSPRTMTRVFADSHSSQRRIVSLGM